MRLVASLALAAAGALLSPPANAAIVGTVPHPSGSFINLHDEAGPCVGDAKRAEFVAADLSKVAGCWVASQGFVMVVFFDADVARIPFPAVRKPVGNS
jgi:hypothetical protein